MASSASSAEASVWRSPLASASIDRWRASAPSPRAAASRCAALIRLVARGAAASTGAASAEAALVKPDIASAIIIPPRKSSPEGVSPGPRPSSRSTGSCGGGPPAATQDSSAAIAGRARSINGVRGRAFRPAGWTNGASPSPSANRASASESCANAAARPSLVQAWGPRGGSWSAAPRKVSTWSAPIRMPAPQAATGSPGISPASSQTGRDSPAAASALSGPAPRAVGPIQAMAPESSWLR